MDEIFKSILKQYIDASNEDFSKHEVASSLRTHFPDFIHKLLDYNTRYEVKGSAGKGNWTHCPWIAILDKVVTTSPQKGYYVVYLFKKDMSGFYLSLNQGVTNVMANYHGKAGDVLKLKAKDFQGRIDHIPARFSSAEINLLGETSTVKNYENGNIISRFYPSDSVPSNKELMEDLVEILEIYDYILYNDDSSSDDLTGQYIEDPKKLRLHYRIERNQNLVKKVKEIQGCKCQACEFEFKSMYGEIGQNFIEAHHLTPISDLEGEEVLLNPKLDFAVLCSNCHRMIHKLEDPSDVVGLRSLIQLMSIAR